MLLTRAPLNNTCIATHVVPCDLHVLNTPPAFVLSQNQTLRKKIRWYKPTPKGWPISQIDLADFLSETRLPRAPSKERAAHNSIFLPLPGMFRLSLKKPPKGVSTPRLYFQGPVPGHTVKELPSRRLKSRSGTLCATIDIPSLDRPASWRPAKLQTPPPTSQHLLMFFFHYFIPFSSYTENIGDYGNFDPLTILCPALFYCPATLRNEVVAGLPAQ